MVRDDPALLSLLNNWNVPASQSPFPQFFRMFFCAEETDKTADPVAVDLLGAVGVVVVTKDLANLIHEF